VPERLELLRHWLTADLALSVDDLTPASSDASFRRYFRVHLEEGSRIAMDAPPEREPLAPYLHVARALYRLGLNVPRVLAVDLDHGFLLLTDLGDTLYLDALNEETVDRLYGDALGALATLQACGPEDLPPYDRPLLLQEMELFREWYLEHHLGAALGRTEQEALEQIFTLLADEALSQPQVPVHRDYHARNLMVCDHNPGILDFQDAVIGPVTYDLVSLLRDCYIAWPRERVEAWALGYHDLALHHGVLHNHCEAQFLRWFDLMGVQRHLKAVGIFARLHHRDGKSSYLNDIPRTLGYLREVAGRYPELEPLQEVLARTAVTGAGDGQ